MEAAGDQSVGDQSVCAAPVMGSSSSSSKLLRYPLRSATRSKEVKPPPAADASSASSVAKRGRPSPAVSKSISALDLSAKDKSAKPPRRLSIPTRSAASPRLATSGSITPISETRTKRSKDQGKSETPLSDVSKSTSIRKFNVVSSVSYWLAQIKLSESASKHSISLGFFKLALEAGCEPLDRVREELKSYMKRHNLLPELQEPLTDLLRSYNIVEDLENLSISDTFSNSTKDGVDKSDEDSHSLSHTARTRNIKPKAAIADTPAVAVNTNNKETVQKGQRSSKSRGAYSKNDANTVLSKAINDNEKRKKPKKPKTQSMYGLTKKSSVESLETGDAAVNPRPTEDEAQDKENLEALATEGTGGTLEM